MLGSLSHLMNARAAGYQELPEYPEVPPDTSVRNVEVCNYVILLISICCVRSCFAVSTYIST